MAHSSAPPSLPPALARPVDVLMIDNFDSFTWNLYQQLTLLNIDVTVIRNDAIPASSLPLLDIRRGLIISPGPGHPKTDAGISADAVRYFKGKIPILGVCMGLEVVVDVFGGEIGYAGEIKHGKLSPIRHDSRGLFSGLPQSFLSTRYHSLSASIRSLPSDNSLQITAITEESGVIMGVRHRVYTIECVQYHPESVLSEEGEELLKNWLGLRGGTWDENPHVRVKDLSLPPFPVDLPPKSVATAGTAMVNGKPGATEGKTNKLPTILEKIHIQRLKDVEVARNTPGASLEDLETLLGMNVAPPRVDIVQRLKDASSIPTADSVPVAIMAEIKRASPSKGPIALRVNAAQQALAYSLASPSSVAVISVLTEPTWFRGSLLDMFATRQAIAHLPHRPAILRKDFIVSEYQIAEARLHGADSVLLIVALLPGPGEVTKKRLGELVAYSRQLGMEPVVEVNNEQELAVALEIGAKVVGVNNRNLHTFEVDMHTTSRLVEALKKQGKEGEVILCALSGISTPDEVRTYKEQGVRAVLVGEALMRSENPGSFIRHLLGLPVPTTVSSDKTPEAQDETGALSASEFPLVKICGILTVDEALTAAQAGADMLGLNFVPGSKRRVSVEVACRIVHAIRERRMSGVVEGDKDQDHGEKEKIENEEKEGNEEENLPWFASHASRLHRTLQSTCGGHTPSRPQLVGIFQDQPLSYTLEIVSRCQLDMVQLHGREPLHYAMYIPVPVVRAFHLPPTSNVGGDGAREENKSVEGVEEITRPGYHKFVLLDAVREDGMSGGSGKKIDWELARAIAEAGEVGPSPFSRGAPKQTQANQVTPTSKNPRLPIILAGGLTPSNVAEAVQQVRPWAVDVAGGVERPDAGGEGGRKDLEKVIAFIRAAKGLSLESEGKEEEEEEKGGVEQVEGQEEGTA